MRGNPETQHVVKVLVAGAKGSGKSAIIFRYSEGVFSKTFQYPNIDFKVKTHNFFGSKVKLQMWPMPLGQLYKCRFSETVLMLIDLTKPYHELCIEIEKFEKICRENLHRLSSVLIVGTKCDAANVNTPMHNLKEKLTRHCSDFFEGCDFDFQVVITSAKDDINIDSMFRDQTEKSLLKQLSKGNKDKYTKRVSTIQKVRLRLELFSSDKPIQKNPQLFGKTPAEFVAKKKELTELLKALYSREDELDKIAEDYPVLREILEQESNPVVTAKPGCAIS